MRHFEKEVKKKTERKIIKRGKETKGNPFHTSSRETHHETFGKRGQHVSKKKDLTGKFHTMCSTITLSNLDSQAKGLSK